MFNLWLAALMYNEGPVSLHPYIEHFVRNIGLLLSFFVASVSFFFGGQREALRIEPRALRVLRSTTEQQFQLVALKLLDLSNPASASPGVVATGHQVLWN